MEGLMIDHSPCNHCHSEDCEWSLWKAVAWWPPSALLPSMTIL
jgi:hypothetical protein